MTPDTTPMPPEPIHMVAHTRTRADGRQVSYTFAVSADPADPTKHDAAELARRVREWVEQEP